MGSGKHSPATKPGENNPLSSKANDALISVWIDYERILPNFTSKYVRTRCLKLVQQKMHKDSNSKEGQDEKINGLLCLVNKKSTHDISRSMNSAKNELCKIGQCFCDLLEPTKEPSYMAVLIVDVSDFSGRMNSLYTEGSFALSGLEQFSRATKKYFDGIIQCVLSHGGDIVKFAGDSVLVCWRPEKDHLTVGTHQAQEEVVFRCYQCAITLLNKYGDYALENIQGPLEIRAFKIHTSMGAGIVNDVNVGVKHSRWEHLLGGDLIKRLGKALGRARGGQLSITKEAFEILNDIVAFEQSDFIERSSTHVVVGKNASIKRIKPSLPLSIGTVVEMWENVVEREGQDLYKNYISPSAIYKLEMDILQSGLFFDNPSLSDLLGFYELRDAVTLFIHFPYLDDWSTDKTLIDAQKTIEITINVIDTFGGVIRQFSYDDKGTSILIFFGIPPSTTIKCIYNAVAAAVNIKDKLGEMSLIPSIGLAYGTVFISGVGNSVRTEYCALGYSINLGARLMCQEAARGAILCDEKTYLESNFNFHFERIEITKPIKGFRSVTHVYKIIGAIYKLPAEFRLTTISKVINNQKNIIGHKFQYEFIKNTITGKIHPSCTEVFGKRDEGLSTLFEYAIENAKSKNIKSVIIVCKCAEMFHRLYIANEIVRRINLIIKKSDIESRYQSLQKISNDIQKKHITLKMSRKLFPNPWNSFSSSDNKKSHSNIQINEFTDSGTPLCSNIERSPIVGYPIDEIINSNENENSHLSSVEKNEEISVKSENLQNEGCVKDLRAFIKHYSFNEDFFMDYPAISEYGVVFLSMKAAADNNIVVMIHELQYMDIESLRLILYAIQILPKLRILVFARPDDVEHGSSLLSPLYQNIDSKFLNKVHIEKLTRYDVNMLVAQIWPFSNKIKGITNESLNALYAASSGSHSYVSAIIHWIKSTGQWRLLPGNFIEFNFGHMSGSIDDFNDITISQFDKLDPSFRLILKVASVASPDLTFDDIYKLLENARWIDVFNLKLNNAESNMIILKKLDVYNFLDLRTSRGVLFVKFSSARVQKLIYDLNVVSHRILLNKIIADSFTKKFNEKKELSTLWYSIMYYEKSGLSNVETLIKHIEILSRYRDGCLSLETKIKLYERLFSIASSRPNRCASVFASFRKWRAIKSHWYKKKAKLHILCGDYKNFIKCTFHSLCLMGCTSTKNRNKICSYCRTEVHNENVENYYPMCNFAIILQQKIRGRNNLNNFISHSPQDIHRRRTISTPLGATVVDNMILSFPNALSIQGIPKKQINYDLKNIEKRVLDYVSKASEIYNNSIFSDSTKKSKVHSSNIDYVEKVFKRINSEDQHFFNTMIIDNLAKYTTISSIKVDRKNLEPFFTLMIGLLKEPGFEPTSLSKYYAAASLVLSTYTRNVKMVEYYMDMAIQNDNMEKIYRTSYIVINIIHTLFYLGLWSLCDVVDSMYFSKHNITNTGYSEQIIFYSIINYIRVFLSGPASKLRELISQLFMFSVKLSSKFSGFYNNIFFELYSLIILDKKSSLLLPSNDTLENKEIILQISLTIYTEMRYCHNPNLCAPMVEAFNAVSNDNFSLSPIALFANTLIMICCLALLIKNPTYYKDKEYKVIQRFSKLVQRRFCGKKLAENLHIMNRPLYSLCEAIVNVYRKGPSGAIGPLKETLSSRDIIGCNLYIRAIFASFLIALDVKHEPEDDPKKLFSELGMTYHEKYGIFGIGVK